MILCFATIIYIYMGSFSCGSTDTSSGNCQETETCMVQVCHTPRQPLQNHPSRHLGGWATTWSAEEMPDGQHQRVDISDHTRTAHKGLLRKRLEEDLCWVVPHVTPTTQSVKWLNWTEIYMGTYIQTDTVEQHTWSFLRLQHQMNIFSLNQLIPQSHWK